MQTGRIKVQKKDERRRQTRMNKTRVRRIGEGKVKGSVASSEGPNGYHQEVMKKKGEREMIRQRRETATGGQRESDKGERVRDKEPCSF